MFRFDSPSLFTWVVQYVIFLFHIENSSHIIAFFLLSHPYVYCLGDSESGAIHKTHARHEHKPSGTRGPIHLLFLFLSLVYLTQPWEGPMV